MAKAVSLMEVKYKVKFLNMFMDEKWGFDLTEARASINDYALFKNYGLEGSDCVYVGDLKGCNNYLNRYVRKYDLKREWEDYRNNI